MEGMEYFYELYESLPRCGPGASEATRRAYDALASLPAHPLILDIGCGTGAQTVELAKVSNGKIIALDNHQPFLDKLMETARTQGLADNISPKNMSMLEMDFDANSFDIIWSEGALYFMGFQNGLQKCRQLLKAKGCLAVTEAVYLLPDPPAPVVKFWENEYPAIKDVQGNINIIKTQGYDLLANFTLSQSAWLENFYLPMGENLEKMNAKYKGDRIALNVFGTMQAEIDIYKNYSDYFGYEFFVLQKID